MVITVPPKKPTPSCSNQKYFFIHRKYCRRISQLKDSLPPHAATCPATNWGINTSPGIAISPSTHKSCPVHCCSQAGDGQRSGIISARSSRRGERVHLKVITETPLLEERCSLFCCLIALNHMGTTAPLWGSTKPCLATATTLQISEAEARGVAECEMKATHNKCQSRLLLFGHITLLKNYAHKYMHCLARSI